MRPRTFLLVFLVLIVVAVIVFLVVTQGSNLFGPTTPEAGNETTAETTSEEDTAAQEPGVPAPESTPEVQLETVVVARVDIPAGQRITRELLEVQQRPNTNIALQGGYVFANPADLIGGIPRVDISEGQAILTPMIALNSTDIASLGSDLATYIDQGRVAIAFPLSLPDDNAAISVRLAALRGAAFAMRPGDLVDIMMSVGVVDIDPEFGTALPNCTYRVDEVALVEGSAFLFPASIQGRLEFNNLINQVIEIVPGALEGEGEGICDTAAQPPIPKRVTQLAVQQAEVLWVGTYRTQEELLEAEAPTPAPVVAEENGEQETGSAAGETGANGETGGTEDMAELEGKICLSPISNELMPCPIIRESTTPDVVILSMTAQDALVLKWALEHGADIDLALRAQGDNTVFVTGSVSLPQLVNDGTIFIPEPLDIGLEPRVDEVEIPILPDVAPSQ